MRHHDSSERTFEGIAKLCSEIEALRTSYHAFLHQFASGWQDTRLADYGQYIDEFVSLTIETYLTQLLKELYASRDPATRIPFKS